MLITSLVLSLFLSSEKEAIHFNLDVSIYKRIEVHVAIANQVLAAF